MDDIGRRRGEPPALSLRDAIRAARVDAAEQAGVVVELRDAELARLAMLNEMLEPVFAEVPVEHADLFDRGLMPGETPRLFVDMVAHIAMGRDRRTYRFLQDSRSGRRVLAESANPTDIVDAVTRYVARRLIAREQVLTSFASEADTLAPLPMPKKAGRRPVSVAREEQPVAPASRGGTILVFLAGLVAGIVLLLGLGLVFSGR
jgi:hypothetical protein